MRVCVFSDQDETWYKGQVEKATDDMGTYLVKCIFFSKHISR